MRYCSTAAAALLLSACTAANPFYVGPTIVGSDGSGLSDGGTGAHDLAGHPSDLASVCTDGQRQCLANTGSGECANGQYMLDRKCPMSSMCMKGYCDPPPSDAATPAGHPCDAGGTAQENQCFSAVTDTLSCEPFITDPSNKMVAWFCAHSVGQGLPGAACTDGSTCRTGFCGSNGTCFRACGAGAPCPVPPNGTVPYRCAGVKILVEGVEVQATSCIP